MRIRQDMCDMKKILVAYVYRTKKLVCGAMKITTKRPETTHRKKKRFFFPKDWLNTSPLDHIFKYWNCNWPSNSANYPRISSFVSLAINFIRAQRDLTLVPLQNTVANRHTHRFIFSNSSPMPKRMCRRSSQQWQNVAGFVAASCNPSSNLIRF